MRLKGVEPPHLSALPKVKKIVSIPSEPLYNITVLRFAINRQKSIDLAKMQLLNIFGGKNRGKNLIINNFIICHLLDLEQKQKVRLIQFI